MGNRQGTAWTSQNLAKHLHTVDRKNEGAGAVITEGKLLKQEKSNFYKGMLNVSDVVAMSGQIRVKTTIVGKAVQAGKVWEDTFGSCTC